MEIKQAIIMAFMGQTKDRFCEYQQARTPEEKIADIGRVKGAKGVEIVFPYELEDRKAIKSALKKHDLGIAAVNVNIKAEPEFVNGSSSVESKAVRDKAIRFIKEGMDAGFHFQGGGLSSARYSIVPGVQSIRAPCPLFSG